MLVGLVLPGCGPSDLSVGPRATQSAAPLTQTEVDSLALPCTKTVAAIGQVQFRYAGVTARAFLCDASPESPGRVVLVEAGTAKQLDLEELQKADAHAYMQTGKVPGELRSKLEANPKSEFTVDVWLRRDDVGLYTKEEIEAQIATPATAKAQLASRSKAAVSGLIAASKSIGQLAVVSDKSLQEHLPVPIVTLRGKAEDLLLLANRDDVSAMSWPLDDIEDHKLSSENYIQSTNLTTLAFLGLNGSGVTVANLEGNSPDSWIHLVPTGTCTSAKCACVQGKTGSHSRATQGVMRNTVTAWGGTASDASVVAANWDKAATPACTVTEAVNWATGKNARVLSRSAPCDIDYTGRLARFLDLAAIQWPYPLVSCASGNSGAQLMSDGAVYNGIAVTGAEPDTANRAQFTRYLGGQAANRLGGNDGWELPHIAAPSRWLDTANKVGSTPDIVSATSASTPVVSGIAATLMEANSNFSGRPEVMVPTLMVSADENVDDDLSGVWPLNLHDNFDDYDGAGVVNAFGAFQVATPGSKRNGGDPAAAYGHDYGAVNSVSNPAGAYYPEVYTASVAPGETLRAAVMLTATPTCGSPATETNCSTIHMPWGALLLFPQAPGEPISINVYNSVQFASWKNTFATTIPVTIRFAVVSWSAATSSYWGLAWTTVGTSN